jgi:hypothetical protein
MVELVVLLELRVDIASLSKNTALLLFCYFRQAERSVHYALTFPNTWPQFLAYYDKTKQTQIAKVIGLLKDAGAESDKVPSRQELFKQNGWMSVGNRSPPPAKCHYRPGFVAIFRQNWPQVPSALAVW